MRDRPVDPTTRRTLFGAAAAAALVATLPAARAQDAWPAAGKPIRFVVPYPPGGVTDLMARLVQAPLSAKLGVPVVIENRAGAGGNIGTDAVAKSAPDGHTMLLAASGPMAVNQTLYKSLSYDPIKDLAPVIQLSAFPLVLLVNPSLPAKDVRELIALAKAKPDSITFASAGNGTPQHLVGELFDKQAGVTMQHVPYKGAGPALVDVIGGQVPVMFDIMGSALPHIRSGKVRPLAVTTLKRSAQLPDVPTLAEAGLPGFDFYAWHGIALSGRTPRPIVERLNRTLLEVFADPEFRKKWEEIGSPVVAASPDDFGTLIRNESVRLGQVVKASGATVD